MKAFLEHFAAILGSVTVAILAISISHEYGYFWTIGRQFQTLLTTTDYFSNGVLWLPVTVLFIYQTIEWRWLREAPDRRVDWHRWGGRIWFMFGVLYAAFMVGTFSWPINWSSGFAIMILAVTLWGRFWRSFCPKVETLDEPFQQLVPWMIRVLPLVVLGTFLYGSIDAYEDLTRTDDVYTFKFSGQMANQPRIFLRNFDKGVLVRNVNDRTIQFYKWDDVVGVKREAPEQTRSIACRVLNFSCPTKRAGQ